MDDSFLVRLDTQFMKLYQPSPLYDELVQNLIEMNEEAPTAPTESEAGEPFDDTLSTYIDDAINAQQQEIAAKEDAEKFIKGLEDRVPIFSPYESQSATNKTEKSDSIVPGSTSSLPPAIAARNHTSAPTTTQSTPPVIN